MLDAKDWAEETFSRCELGDKRLNKRLICIASDLASNIGQSLSSCCEGNNTALVAGYRFIRNDSISAEGIMQGVILNTVEKAQESAVLLAHEDTTTLKYNHSVKDELGYCSASLESSAAGYMMAHTSMLMDGNTGKTIGIIHQNRWIRNHEDFGKRNNRKIRCYKEKESFKWENTSREIARNLGDQLPKLISICDREADILEYMQYKLHEKQRFIVRARHDRALYEDFGENISSYMCAKTELGQYQINIEQKSGREARVATISLKSGSVELKSTKEMSEKGTESIIVNIVTAVEVGKCLDNSRVTWVLLTTEPVDTYEQAMTVIGYYQQRWRIEEFHKCWKSGTKVENLRMQSIENLERGIVILAPIAIRLMQLRECIGEEKTEEEPCTHLLSPEEFIVLWCSIEKKKKAPKKMPTMKWVYQAIAKLGGWSDSKHTGIASYDAMWRGWFRLTERMQGYFVGAC
jgi:hypothetical protein